MDLPSGTVTFLFSDLEVSTRLWEQHHAAMVDARARYFDLVDGAVVAHGGVVFSHAGDGVAAAFSSAPEALLAAVDATRALATEPWGETGTLAAHMALHTGEGVVVGADQYDSQPLNRCARLMGVAHGGQLLVSGATAALVTDALVDGIALGDLGEHRLRDLAHPMRIFQVHAPGLRDEFPPLAFPDTFPGNLPLPTTAFIGREREIGRTVTALEDARVVTLTGVGGVGKTRLALQVAANVVPSFREGAWFVELAPVRDPEGVVDAVSTVLGAQPRGGQTAEDALTDSLRTKQLLLVLDNCEHVLDAVAELVEEIRSTCQGIVVLATSREGLALDGERMIAVPSLGSPPPEADFDAVGTSDAVRLFVDRAMAADADFALTPSNAPAVADVCRRLDGVPLAILLAAALVTSMSPAELGSALDRRFDVLAGGRRRAVKRHQTLRATIDWSYDLLDEAHQQLLVRLSVFSGGCARDAAEVICGTGAIDARDVRGLLTDLVDRSLLVAERGDAETRYRLLETIREYGEERLDPDEAAALRDAHARYYADYGFRCTRGLESAERIVWSIRINADAENTLAAFLHAIDTGDIDLVVDMLEAAPPWSQQASSWMSFPVDQAFAMQGVEEHPAYPVMLVVAATATDRRGEGTRALEFADAALEAERAAGGPSGYSMDIVAARLYTLGLVASSAGRDDDAAAAWLEAAECFRDTDPYQAGRALGAAASALCFAGRAHEAVAVATEGAALERHAGIPVDRLTMSALAMALAPEDRERARAALLEAMQDPVSANFGEALQLSLAAAAIGDWVLTGQLSMTSIPLLQFVNHRPYLQVAFSVTVRSLAEADPEGAATIQGAAHALSKSFAPAEVPVTHAGGSEAPRGQGGVIVDARREATAILRAALGEERLGALRERGAAMDSDAAVAYAMTRLAAFVADATD